MKNVFPKSLRGTSPFSAGDKLIFKISLLLLGFGVTVLGGRILSSTTTGISVRGGTLKEGVVAETTTLKPRFNGNPRPSTPLIYSSLVNFKPNGEIAMDLARDFSVQKKGKVFIFNLRKNAKWHDGKKVTARDIVYTVDKITAEKSTSPLKSNWESVKYKAVDNYKIKFTLPNPYPAFIMNATIPILPSHINSEQQRKRPIGSGPFQVAKIKRGKKNINKAILTRNENYYLTKPSLNKISLKYYSKSEKLKQAFIKGKINSFKNSTSLKPPKKAEVESAILPQYFAIFFNTEKNDLTQAQEARKGLRAATDKKKITETIFADRARPIKNPIPNFILGKASDQPDRNWSADLNKAKKLLEPYQGAEIIITTPDTPFLKKTATMLKKQWEKAGVKVKVESAPSEKILKNKVQPRKYEALLFGQGLSFEPDPFSLWHSSQIENPGLNLSLYQNQKVDELLEDARQEMETAKRIELYSQLNQEIRKGCPAIFLYSPSSVYIHKSGIKGIKLDYLNSSNGRFNQISSWHINEKKVWTK